MEKIAVNDIMTDVSKTNAALIAEARECGPARNADEYLIERLADALEAAEKEIERIDYHRGHWKDEFEALEAATRVPVQGEPNDEQVEAAAKAIADCHNPGMFEKYPENWRVEARAALVAAAGVGKEKSE